MLFAPIPDLPDRKTICIMERGNEKCQPKNENTQRRRVTMRPSRRGQCGWSPSREVAAELGICIDTLRSWLKAAGAPSPGQADRQNRDARRLRELEAEIRALRKKLEEKDGVIDILKKSVGILSKP